MKISTRVQYALRMMADVARNGGQGEVVPVGDIARRQNLSRLYLSQLTVPLKNAGLLKSVWGNKGGFLLGRPAGAIKVLDIMEAVDGPVCLIDCIYDPNYCDRTANCECIRIWREVNEGIVRTLASCTLEDLISPKMNSGVQS
ncbi:MAG: Rrf2 family transcriptional regulator [Acidobacteria bacterium]|nr:Rrf2 family transcriptional regulator [Acidobacteriota bacterium]